MASQNDIGALHYTKNDTPTPASIGAMHKAPSAFLSHVLLKPARGIQLNRNHPLARGLVGCWLMNEGTGNQVFDISKNNRHGILQGNAVFAPTHFGSGVYLTGNSSDYIDCGFKGNFGQKVTISVWIAFDDLVGGTRDGIFGSRYYYDGEFSIDLHDTNSQFFLCLGSAKYAYWNLNPQLTLGKYHHLVWRIDTTQTSNSDKVVMFVDGIRRQQTGFLGITNESVTATSYPVKIGKIEQSYPTATFDNVAMWQRALSASEIALLYREPFCMFEGGISPANLFTETAGANYGAAMYHHLQQLGVYS